jgi:hypothetical protein
MRKAPPFDGAPFHLSSSMMAAIATSTCATSIISTIFMDHSIDRLVPRTC